MEKCKRNLTNDENVQSSVDWLTEVIRRFSDNALAARSLSAVTMRSPLRTDQVCNALALSIRLLMMVQWKKNQQVRYTDRDWSKEEIVAFEDAISIHGAELRAVREEVASRTMPEVVRFYGHWKR